MIGIERNKSPDLTPKQRNTSWFVILDDRKHGRSGKFPVFYDIDTGDYLEPPEGFLDSEYETLREWYLVHPEDDPNNSLHKPAMRDASVPLSADNQIKEHSDLTEADIPPIGDTDEEDGIDCVIEPDSVAEETVAVVEAPVVESPVVPVVTPPVSENMITVDDDWDDAPPF